MDEQKAHRAYVCCGPNCTLRGSTRLVDVLQREVDEAGLAEEVEVMPGGCMKHCERGPSMVVWPGRIYYEFVDQPKLRRIVREHIGAGCPVRDYFYREPAEAEQERAAERRRDAQRALEERLGRPARRDGQAQQDTRPTPSSTDRQRQRKHRPSWRQSEGEVDDFKW